MTAAVLIAVFVVILLMLPLWPLCIVAIGVICLASWEYYQMVLPKKGIAEKIFYLLLAAIVPMAVCSGDTALVTGALFISFFGISFLYLFRIRCLGDQFRDMACAFTGILYISFLLSHFLLIRNMEHGSAWLFLILIVTYFGDGAAYFAGTYLGKHALYALLSPKKTIEGAFGGLLGSVLAAYVCKYTFLRHIGTSDILWIALALGVSGQIGDMVESLIKRSVDVKDSGSLLPGHGGFLDRIDSILFAGPVGYYLALYITLRMLHVMSRV